MQLIETKCDNNGNLFKKIEKMETIDCVTTNRIHQCSFDVRYLPWEKKKENQFKYNLFCK